MQEEEGIMGEEPVKKEGFPLPNKKAFEESRCPLCGCAVEPATEVQKEYARRHPILCIPCLEARNESRTKLKAHARMKKAREAGAGSCAWPAA